MSKPKAPESLGEVWDAEVAEAFGNLNPRQQNFVTAYLETGVSAEAYRRAYNAQATDHLAAVHGSRLLTNADIRIILTKFEDRKTDALFTVVRTYFDMTGAKRETETGEKPDWRTRREGADGLSRIFGLNAPEVVRDDRFAALMERINGKVES